MDAGVYDHIQEEALKRDQTASQASNSVSEGNSSDTTKKAEEPGNLTTDLQETYRSFTASPWGVKIGGFWGTVNKQAQSYIQEAQKEASAASQSAFKGFSDLKTSLEGRARTFSNDFGKTGEETENKGEQKVEHDPKEQEKDGSGGPAADEPSSPAFIERFRSEAARRLQDLQRAEDAADEALLKFGTNIRNFLRDAVTVTPPLESEDGDKKGDGSVLFESKDADGRRVIHTTRFDAQLHVIHCSLDSFTKDPASAEYEKWQAEFDIEKRTEQIAADLKKYEELRRAMEKLVPKKVDYPTFWKRYYFLRLVIESEEKRRREMLKAAASKSTSTSDVAWDEDSDEDNDEGPSTPQPRASTDASASATAAADAAAAAASSTPLATSGHLKEPRKSHDEKSSAGSESSYDLVSGATSAAPGSPMEKKEKGGKKGEKDDSDEEADWE